MNFEDIFNIDAMQVSSGPGFEHHQTSFESTSPFWDLSSYDPLDPIHSASTTKTFAGVVHAPDMTGNNDDLIPKLSMSDWTPAVAETSFDQFVNCTDIWPSDINDNSIHLKDKPGSAITSTTTQPCLQDRQAPNHDGPSLPRLKRNRSMSSANNGHTDGISKEPPRQSKRSRPPRFSAGQNAVLEAWLAQNEARLYPTTEEKHQLSDQSSLTVRQIELWFARTRQRKLFHKDTSDQKMLQPTATLCGSSTIASDSSPLPGGIPYCVQEAPINAAQFLNVQSSSAHPISMSRDREIQVPVDLDELQCLSAIPAESSLEVNAASPGYGDWDRGGVNFSDRSGDSCPRAGPLFEARFCGSKLSWIQAWMSTLPVESEDYELLSVPGTGLNCDAPSLRQFSDSKIDCPSPTERAVYDEVFRPYGLLEDNLSTLGELSRGHGLFDLDSNGSSHIDAPLVGFRNTYDGFYHVPNRVDADDNASQGADSAGSAGSACSYTSYGPRKGRKVPHRAMPIRRESVSKPTVKSTAYWCTFCRHRFNSKYSWRRHEESVHVPQQMWVCGRPPDFASQDEFIKFTQTLYTEYGPGSHKGQSGSFLQCWEKSEESRTFYRVDHLSQHLHGVHGRTLPVVSLKIFSRPAPMKNDCLGCGFCGRRQHTWSARVQHIAEHFQSGLDMRSWMYWRALV